MAQEIGCFMSRFIITRIAKEEANNCQRSGIIESFGRKKGFSVDNVDARCRFYQSHAMQMRRKRVSLIKN